MTGDRAGRAARLLSRPGVRLHADGGGAYAVRPGDDRRRRPLLLIDEADFHRLVHEPGLKPAGPGVFVLAARQAEPADDRAGRPSHIEGEREILGPEGRRRVRVNLGESPIAWLARRRNGAGEPWLSLPEIAAAERLRDDFVVAGMVGRLTMAWDAGPKASGGRGPGVEPAERARGAKDRIRRALAAIGPDLSGLVSRICLAGSALEAAERDLGLPRRSGKVLLKLALGRLATHYGFAGGASGA